jgi:predicted mannosyl-3-phosphoglycerate phosphatase (HAD superfamily)
MTAMTLDTLKEKNYCSKDDHLLDIMLDYYRKLGSLRSELQSLGDVLHALRLLENHDHAQRISGHISKANESILDFVVTSFIRRIPAFFLFRPCLVHVRPAADR